MAIKLDSRNDYAFTLRGLAFHAKFEHDKAIEDYTEAISINPNSYAAYYNRANTLQYGNKEFDKAIADYTEALRINPQYSLGFNGRGTAYQIGRKTMPKPWRITTRPFS